MPHEYCLPTGKVIHDTQSLAQKALVLLKQQRDYGGAVYKCKDCGLWHIGRARNPKTGTFDGRASWIRTKKPRRR